MEALKYRTEVLRKKLNQIQGRLEQLSQRLEQLKALEASYNERVARIEHTKQKIHMVRSIIQR